MKQRLEHFSARISLPTVQGEVVALVPAVLVYFDGLLLCSKAILGCSAADA